MTNRSWIAGILLLGLAGGAWTLHAQSQGPEQAPAQVAPEAPLGLAQGVTAIPGMAVALDGKTPLAGVTLVFQDASEAVLAKVVVAEDGSFDCPAVAAGNYLVWVANQPSMIRFDASPKFLRLVTARPAADHVQIASRSIDTPMTCPICGFSMNCPNHADPCPWLQGQMDAHYASAHPGQTPPDVTAGSSSAATTVGLAAGGAAVVVGGIVGGVSLAADDNSAPTLRALTPAGP